MESLKDLIITAVIRAASIIITAAEWIYVHFIELNIFDKLLIITVIPAFLAVVKPSARFFIYDHWFYINNPMSVNMIGIVFLIFVTLCIPPIFALVLRAVPASLYMIWTIYMQASHTIAHMKDPYQLTVWHYLNILVPLLMVIFSIMSYAAYGRNRS